MRIYCYKLYSVFICTRIIFLSTRISLTTTKNIKVFIKFYTNEMTIFKIPISDFKIIIVDKKTEWLRATYPLTIIHFGNVMVRVILTPRELFLCVYTPKTWIWCHGLNSHSLDWSERETVSTSWIRGEGICSPLSQNIRWPLIDPLLFKT